MLLSRDQWIGCGLNPASFAKNSVFLRNAKGNLVGSSTFAPSVGKPMQHHTSAVVLSPSPSSKMAGVERNILVVLLIRSNIPIRLGVLSDWLNYHPDREAVQYLEAGFQEEFKISFTGATNTLYSKP